MKCSWCGNEVNICGSSWECGWCGNFGTCIEITPPQLTLTLSVVCEVDLENVWSDMKNAIRCLAPSQPALSRLLGKVLLHSISAAMRHAGAMPSREKTDELRAFLVSTPDLMPGNDVRNILINVGQSVLYREEAELSEQLCGSFWQALISARPPEEYYNNVDPDGLDDLLSGLSSVYAYFGGRKNREISDASDYRDALLEAFYIHRRNIVLLHPDFERARRQLSEGKFPDSEDICRELLLDKFPEEVPHETAEAFSELSWNYILDDVFERDTAKGIKMWRTLLDAAGPVLRNSPHTAERLLRRRDWVDPTMPDKALPLLAALEDAVFMSQLFASAFIGGLQFDVLSICLARGQTELGRRCLDTALENPHLGEYWEQQFRRKFSAAFFTASAKPSHRANSPAADTETDDAEVFHYCTVNLFGASRHYTYLTGGLPLKVGDWVELPFGKEDSVRQGQVMAVMDCTRIAAPRPPEQTKNVLRVITAPASNQPTKSGE